MDAVLLPQTMAASQEQSAGIEQENQATQQNAALIEQAGAASGALQDQAGKLAQVVSKAHLNQAQLTIVASPEPMEQGGRRLSICQTL